MQPIIRSGVASDAEGVYDVFVRATADLNQRMGLPDAVLKKVYADNARRVVKGLPRG